MIRKYLPYVLIATSLVLLIVLMTTINNRQAEGLGIMHPTTVIEAVVSILLMTIGIAMVLKRL